MMGRVGRKASLAALTAAYDNGVIFYDTARSYGYGESEALLGDFFTAAATTYCCPPNSVFDPHARAP